MPSARPLLLALAALALAGCGRHDYEPPAPAESLDPSPKAQPLPATSPEPTSDTCGASKVGAFLNRLPDATLMAQIREAIGHGRTRTIGPGQAVTMEFSAGRLNIEIGDDGKIRLFRCG